MTVNHSLRVLGREIGRTLLEIDVKWMSTADSDVAVTELTRLFNRIWHEEKVADQSWGRKA